MNKIQYIIHLFQNFSLFFIILKCVYVSGGDEAEAKTNKPTRGGAPTIPNGTARDRVVLSRRHGQTLNSLMQIVVSFFLARFLICLGTKRAQTVSNLAENLHT